MTITICTPVSYSGFRIRSLGLMVCKYAPGLNKTLFFLASSSAALTGSLSLSILFCSSAFLASLFRSFL